MSSFDWVDDRFIKEFEARGLVTSTFVRLDTDRRCQVLEALLQESAKSGPERINIKDVARSARVPVGSLYQYFGDRENMARFATVVVARKLSSDLEQYIPYLEALPLREALTLYLKTGIDWSIQEAASFRSFVAAAYGASVKGSVFTDSMDGAESKIEKENGDWYTKALLRPTSKAILKVVRRIIAATASRGELREGIDTDIAARLTNVLLIAVGDARMMPGLDEYYLLYNGDSSPESRIEEAVEFICRSLLP